MLRLNKKLSEVQGLSLRTTLLCIASILGTVQLLPGRGGGWKIRGGIVENGNKREGGWM